jgi:PadR family transcriptional regulator PadR
MTNGSQGASDILENLKLELRRGCLIVAVLAQLGTEQYGYTLRKALADDGLAIDEGTLYPLLRRLETQGLLVSQWREEDKRTAFLPAVDSRSDFGPVARRVGKHQQVA